MEHVMSGRPYYHNSEKLLNCRRAGYGVRNFLKSLLFEIKKNNWTVITCFDLITELHTK